MKSVMAVMAMALACGVAFAKVPVGANVLANGRFEAADELDPPCWRGVSAAGELLKGVGPDGLAAVRLSANGSVSQNFKQSGLNLKPNGKYVLKFRYRSPGSRFKRCAGSLIVGPWAAEDSILLKNNVTEWTWAEKTVVAKDYPKNNVHSLVFVVSDLKKGAVDFADVSLSPADEATATETSESSLLGVGKKLRLVPIAPRLDEIPRGKRQIAFHFYGELPADAADAVAEFDFGAAGVVRKMPKVVSAEPLRIPDGATGGTFVARLKAGEKVLFERTYAYAFAADVTKTEIGKRLNNFCTELVNEVRKAGQSTLAFGCRHRAWYYVDVPGKVLADGCPVVRFVELPAGDHEFTFDLPKDGRVTVRRITETLHYATGADSPVRQWPSYGWDFCERYVNPYVTTQSTPRFSPSYIRQLRERGVRMLLNIYSAGLATPEDLQKRMRGNRAFSGKNQYLFDGLSLDEQYLNDGVVMNNFADGLWGFEDKARDDRHVYSWFCGNPKATGIDHDALSAAVNALGGRAKILFELYFKTIPSDEAAAKRFIRDEALGTLKAYEAFCPRVVDRLGIVLGAFNQTGYMTLWQHPEVDYKYYLDLQFNCLANDPAFKDLGITGLWGATLADDDLYRWGFQLLRHYVFEGRTDLLSAHHGLAYHGLVQNGDFTDGLEGWEAIGAVTTGKYALLGAKAEGRWHVPAGLGDTCAVLPTKRSKEATGVATTVRGLVPGRHYRLTFCSVNVRDLEKNARNVYDHGIVADLGKGADVDRARSWIEPAPASYRKADDEGTKCNLHTYIFTATANETRLEITNRDAANGDNLAVNFISVLPYLPAE